MECERCKAVIGDGEENEVNGQVLCEDCCMDLLSPAKACDPWAVYSAKSFKEKQGRELELTRIQKKILVLLENKGPIPPDDLAGQLQMSLKDLGREIAVLRHMEKIRGELREGKRLIRAWD